MFLLQTFLFLFHVAVRLCLFWVQGTAPTQVKRIKVPPQPHQCKPGRLACTHRIASQFTKAFVNSEFGPEFRAEECFQHLLPQKDQACQLLLAREAEPVISVTLQWFPGCLPQPSPMPGAGSKAAPPAFVLISRHQGVLPGNSSPRNTTVLASGDKRHNFSCQGLNKKKSKSNHPFMLC